MAVTVISESPLSIGGDVVDGRVLVDGRGVADALGWELKPEGLCRGDVCVPLPPGAASGGRVDLVRAAAALGRPAVVDAGLGAVAVALPSEERRRALDDLEAPAFTLPDLDGVPHELGEWQGRKRLLIAFSTW
ncbi:MAG TPA: hypothetical protein VFA83_07930 [Acidimicrobiales bacterium]|nr:hypothetical protein [Acidimicrobiales bacterium]